mmetsp:Transcript_68055/g.163356  ORF Transcript_68055/g.163356 Transcript_68055/m.163356 type:complete len:475 (-) Transcript_68055:167-1591(-)
MASAPSSTTATCGLIGSRADLPWLVTLEVIATSSAEVSGFTNASQGAAVRAGKSDEPQEIEKLPVTRNVAVRIPYVVSALSSPWQGAPHARQKSNINSSVVQVYMPPGCPSSVLRAITTRLAVDADEAAGEQGLAARWWPKDLASALRLAQVASMLQIDELMPELVALVREAATLTGDFATLEAACERLELPAELREAAALMKVSAEPVSLPDEAQVRGMIASALLTADGKVWRVVQKVIDRREGWPHLAKENAAVLLAYATGAHGNIRARPHTGFFWGSRDFLYLVCRYVRERTEHFDAMVSAMFDYVYNMDPELPAEIIDAVFKELLVHDGLSLGQCEHVIKKLMQRETMLEYLFHEWSGVFPVLPAHARQALSKGLLPAIGRCPHPALDFILDELDSAPQPGGRGTKECLARVLRLQLFGSTAELVLARWRARARTQLQHAWPVGNIAAALLAVLIAVMSVYFQLRLFSFR